ncbi:hypothetical protein CRE_06952 [Caenorhabditis remanei]|uniref:Uncharacterized protein n=1 Tax=Caenorhabditis remanei TaxID=31234 RepID=E3N6L7_CAERE|nr:hypothetical protein CRE_06952 [Caenorhabditis remanei]
MVTTSCNKCSEIIEEGEEINHLTSCDQSLFSCKTCKQLIQVLSIGRHQCIPQIVIEDVDGNGVQEEMEPVDYNVPQALQQQQGVPDQEIRFRGPVGEVERHIVQDQGNEAAPDESAPKPLNDRPLNNDDYTPPFITMFLMLWSGAVPVVEDWFNWGGIIWSGWDHLSSAVYLVTIASIVVPRFLSHKCSSSCGVLVSAFLSVLFNQSSRICFATTFCCFCATSSSSLVTSFRKLVWDRETLDYVPRVWLAVALVFLLWEFIRRFVEYSKSESRVHPVLLRVLNA